MTLKRSLVIRVIRCVLLAFFFIVVTQDVQFFPYALSSYLSPVKFEGGYIPKDVSPMKVKTRSGTEIDVWVMEPQNVTPPGPIRNAILFHGNGGPMLMFVGMQVWLSAHGIRSFSFDYPGYGNSSGWPTEASVTESAQAVWERMKELGYGNPDETLIYGFSIGTGPAAILASEIQPAAVLLIASYSSIPDIVGRHPVFKYFRPFLYYTFPAAEAIAQLKRSCLIVIHGEQDSVIPIELGKKLYSRYRGSGKHLFMSAPKSEHNSVFADTGNHAAEALRSCFQPAT